ncbi:MAG: UDP-N-acetylmuramoyl-L-alanine--D-glutamate ligase [Thiotrichales bacterium]|nr:UDP-N-acetylmuramoyl-L-alanine--D-glutamate ligase [Thiotrichales bacterium]
MKLILGLGVTGLSVARFFIRNNISFRIADSRQDPPMLQICKNENLLHDFYFGDWSESLLEDISEVIISPGIAGSESIVRWIRAKNISIISDIELFGRYVKAPMIGITGSNGKSTVTQLLGEMALASSLKTYICGNIGNPVMECISDDAELYIVELSSYQLDYTNKLDLFAGVITNISPDHLDRYSSYSNYISSKLSIYDYSMFNIINLNEPEVNGISGDNFFSIEKNESKCDFFASKKDNFYEVFHQSKVLMTSDDLLVVGKHNIENMLASLTLGYRFGLSINTMKEAAIEFKGLVHRLEFVSTMNQVDFYNDSKSTNAISTITAINALYTKYTNLVLILGGIAKKEDYSEMFKLINQKVKTVVLIGESSSDFFRHIDGPWVVISESMKEAVEVSKAVAESGAVVLSPGCASFDMFDNFSNRGEVFKHHVLEDN